MSGDSLKLKTWVRIRKNGKLVYEGENTITTVGKEEFAQNIANDGTPSYISHVAAGSDNTVTTEDMTALQGTEHDRQTVTTTRTGNSITYAGTIGAGISGAVTIGEFGLFDASSGGNMFARFTLALTISFAASDEIDVDWTIEVGN